MSESLKEQYATTPLYAANATAVESMYEQFLEDPDSVPAAWRNYFETLGAADTEIAHSAIRDDLVAEARSGGRAVVRARRTGSGSAVPS